MNAFMLGCWECLLQGVAWMLGVAKFSSTELWIPWRKMKVKKCIQFKIFSFHIFWIIFLLPDIPFPKNPHLYSLSLSKYNKTKKPPNFKQTTKHRKYGVHFVLVDYWAWGQLRSVADVSSDTSLKKIILPLPAHML